MADGDTQTLASGHTRRSIQIATGTDAATLIPAVADTAYDVDRLALTLIGSTSGWVQLQEADGDVIGGRRRVQADIPTFLTWDREDGVRTDTANKALVLTRGQSFAVDGEIKYSTRSA